jgi:hypothetical protein
MEQERFDPDFQELYNRYIREEEEQAAEVYKEISHELKLPEPKARRWWYPAAAAAILVLAAGTWAVTSESGPFHPKPGYSKAEIRESLEKTIHALSTYSKTVKEEFSRIGDLSAMSQAIKPAKKSVTPNVRNESNTTKN